MARACQSLAEVRNLSCHYGVCLLASGQRDQFSSEMLNNKQISEIEPDVVRHNAAKYSCSVD